VIRCTSGARRFARAFCGAGKNVGLGIVDEEPAQGIGLPALLPRAESLHLTPDAFWALTPAELQLMLGVNGAGTAAGGWAAALMAAYPNREREED